MIRANATCRKCGRELAPGTPAWAEDWNVITAEGVRLETRYVCEACALEPGRTPH